MEILDKKSTEINSFFTGLDDLLDTIGKALKNRTPHLNGEKFLELPDITMLGALTNYISFEEHKHFQPVNSNWGIVKTLDADKKTRKNKKLKNELLAKRSIDYLETLELI